MTYSGGSTSANEFISKYASNGQLLNLYSDEWGANQSSLEGMSIADFKRYDDLYGANYRNHLLLISCESHNLSDSKLSDDLLKVFPKCKDQLKDYSDDVYYDPCFVLINLATKQMLAVVLGNKNRMFITDVENNESIPYDMDGDLTAQNLFGNSDRAYLSKFLKFDHAGIAHNFLKSLFEIGNHVYCRDCDCTEYLYGELSYAAPDDEGMYEVDGDTYTSEDRDEMMETHESYQKKIKTNNELLRKFFPKIDFESLCDY